MDIAKVAALYEQLAVKATNGAQALAAVACVEATPDRSATLDHAAAFHRGRAEAFRVARDCLLTQIANPPA